MNPFRLAFLNLLRRPGSTLTGIIAIGLAVGIGGMLLRLHLVGAERFGNMIRSGDAVIGAKAGNLDILLNSMNLEGEYPGFFTHRLFWSLQNRHRLDFMENPQGIAALVPIVYCARYKGARVIGTTDDFLRQPGLEVRFAEGKWVGLGSEAVVGASLARREKLRVGDRINVQAWSDANPAVTSIIPHGFVVSGIMEPLGNRWDGALFVGMAEARKILERSPAAESSPWGAEVLHYIIVHLHPGGFAGLRNLVNNMTVAQAISVPEAVAQLERLTGTSRSLSMAAIILALVLGALSVAGLFSGRFEALSAELAVLRALGYSRRATTSRLLWEAALLGGFACLLGIMMDFSLFPWLRGWLGASLPGPDELSIGLWRSSPVWVAAIIATLLAASLPLYRLYRLDAHSTLRRTT